MREKGVPDFSICECGFKHFWRNADTGIFNNVTRSTIQRSDDKVEVLHVSDNSAVGILPGSFKCPN